MSNEAWIVNVMRKHRLTISYSEGFVETEGGYAVYWGIGEEFSTLEGALQHMVNRFSYGEKNDCTR